MGAHASRVYIWAEDGPHFADQPHLSRDGLALTDKHLAHGYLSSMRSMLLSRVRLQPAFDSNGNFLDTISQNPSRHDSMHSVNPATANAKRLDACFKSPPSHFLSAWEDEFHVVEYSSSGLLERFCDIRIIPAAGLLTVVAMLLTPGGQLPEHCPRHSWHTHILWAMLALSPPLVLALESQIMLAFIQKLQREHLSRLYNFLVCLVVVFLWLTVMHLGLEREVTRIVSGGEFSNISGRCTQIRHVTVLTNFSSLPPSRTCVDHDPRKTVLSWPFLHASGCETLLVDSTYPRILEILFLFPLMRCHWMAAATSTAITGIFLFFASVFTGSYGRHLWYRLAMHMCMGCASGLNMSEVCIPKRVCHM